ncbi:hypothetical protein BDP27DRAFT_1211155 [Rhodocollybia butyracea]|uniref:Uncharacterized protein n=1 Tax=Rhodocollybia butyracea TaxID=206335 RepID=A0A9P5UED0_9AGAR|nr:hypothetical protein BDP27DRAFT_1211155 [Rhodocollybia butyracea]
MATLPSFLQPLKVAQVSSSLYIHSVFQHSEPFGSAETLWWPNAEPKTFVFFIPGNPGLSGFYISFLSALYQNLSNICILAQSHLGHTEAATSTESSLQSQVASAIEAFDALKKTFPTSKAIIIGHSVGSWISLQVLKARLNEVDSLFLLFPTIANILDTPNGRTLSWAFRPPFPYLIAKISFLLRLFPSKVLSAVFHGWPDTQLDVLRRLLRSPSCVQACLSMAHEEMGTIRELDVNLLETHKHCIHMYFAETDGWVGKNKDVVLRSFTPDHGSVRIVHGNHGIPHAFCISM